MLKKSQQPRPEQMEFDLVSPWLVSPTLRQMEKVRRKAGMASPWGDYEKEKSLAALTVRLHALDLCDERRISLNDELAELRVLSGPAYWNSHKKIWTARARRNVRRLKKIILVVRHQLNLIS
jgi:hypothetical protein